MIYSNPHQLSRLVILARLMVEDDQASCTTFTTDIHDPLTGGQFLETQYYADVLASIPGETIIEILKYPATVSDLWNEIRMRRNALLGDCDWTQMPDAPLTIEEKHAWSIYRQVLRDIPQDFMLPTDVVFPNKPGAE